MMVAGMSFMAMQPALKDARANQAFDDVLMQLRIARQRAIAERKQYIVCFGVAAPPGALTPLGAPTAQSIQMFRWDAGTALSAAAQISENQLPTDMQIPGCDWDARILRRQCRMDLAMAPSPSISTKAWRGAIKNQVMFMPDGSAHDINGSWNSGIIYVGAPRRSVQLARSHSVRSNRKNPRMAPDEPVREGRNGFNNDGKSARHAIAGFGRKSRQQGFALLETLIAIVVLMIGLLAVLATFAMAIGNTTSVQNDSIARQKAAEAVESIYTARQTSQITFDQIQNVGAGTGIFTVGFTPMMDPGPDGLDNTGDDVPAAPIRLPGASGVITNTCR